MRILMLVEGYNALGGIAEIVESLALEFKHRGHTVAIVSTRDPRAVTSGYERSHNHSIECIYQNIWNRKPIGLRHLETLVRIPWHARFGGFARLLRTWQPDVVNSHLWAWDRYPTIVSACRAAQVPLVQSFHVTDERGRGRLGVRGLRALERSAAIIAGSAATRDFFSTRLTAAQRAHVIIGGVDARAAANAVAYVHDGGRPYVFSACRFNLEHKALDVLIAAFRVVASEFREIDLLIAGSGPDFAHVARLARSSGFGERIKLLGVKSRNDLRALHLGAMIFVLPSRPGECIPLVYLEAMAAGTPVIGTDTGGAREVIDSGVHGFLLPPGDVEGTAEAIRKLLTDEPMRREMGARAQRLAAANFTWAKCAADYLTVYRKCLRTGGPALPPKPS
jgi:glycosyltransferase involved in cell wall biosynthesis